MKRRLLVGLCPLLLAAGARAEAPEPGREYVSAQIASGDARSLSQAYKRYADLPYLRVEKRGNLYVLRAGFWASNKQAKAALAGSSLEKPLIMGAVFRPEAIVQSNWQGPPPAQAIIRAVAQPTAPVFGRASGPLPEPMLLLAAAPSRAADGPLKPAQNPALRMSRDAAPAPPPAPVDPALAGSAEVRKAAGAVLDEREELRPFNQEDYTLAYEIFVGAGDLRRGFLVAQKAVASVPEDMDWRLKLARVAEWTQKPAVAWAQRDYMFRRGDRSNDTITALLRLAPVAPNFDTVILVWQYKASTGTLTRAQWDDLAYLYDAASRPLDGSLYFEAQFRRTSDLRLLEKAAQLSENGGDEARAYQLTIERLKYKPFPVELALHAVGYLLRQDRSKEAYALMEQHRSEVPDGSVEFWQTLAQTAWELSELGGAEEAYRKYLGAAKDPVVEDWSRLVALVRQRSPAEGARLAMEVYRRYKSLDYLILALTIRTDANDFSNQARIFASLSPQEMAEAEKSAAFLSLRAQYFQRINDEERAWSDFRRAMAINNGADADITVTALWFLIDSRRRSDLEDMLARMRPQAMENSAFWGAYAAAFQAIDKPRESIFWYRKEMQRQPDDVLLQLNYADVLDRYQQTGQADRVRQQVWMRLRDRLPTASTKIPFDADPELLSTIRLALLNRPGDPALALVRDISAQFRGLAASGADDRETRTLVLAWAVSTEQFHNAKSWMWLRYAQSVAKRTLAAQQEYDPKRADPRGPPPLWAEIQTALQLNDTQTMDRLLTTQGDALPIYNRYDTAYALNHYQQALNIAFHGMERNPVDEELHDRFRQHAPLYNNYMQLMTTRDVFGDVSSRSWQFEGRYAIARDWQLKVGYARAMQSSSDIEFSDLVPATDRLTNLEARWLYSPDTNTTLALFRRSEATARMGARVTQEYRVNNRVSLEGVAEMRGTSTQSTPMRVAGYTNNLRMTLNYELSKREYIAISPRIDRFYTQWDDYLGMAKQIEFDAGYRIRTEYPDWRVRLFVIRQVVTRGGSVAASTIARLPAAVQQDIAEGGTSPTEYFLPGGSTEVGACVGEGENIAGSNLQETYTRAWRPFFEACQQHNSVNGNGYIGFIGVAGSVIGPDHLSLRLDIARGGVGTGNFLRTLALRYRYYF